jgi:hypothetical protein
VRKLVEAEAKLIERAEAVKQLSDGLSVVNAQWKAAEARAIELEVKLNDSYADADRAEEERNEAQAHAARLAMLTCNCGYNDLQDALSAASATPADSAAYLAALEAEHEAAGRYHGFAPDTDPWNQINLGKLWNAVEAAKAKGGAK